MMRASTSSLIAVALAACAHRGPATVAPPVPPAASAAPTAPIGDALLPARVRRLTNLEYERSAARLLGIPVSIADQLPPEVRQEGYTPNAAQTVPSAWAARVATFAAEAAHRAVAAHPPDVGASAEERAAWVARTGRRAFRRPLEPAEAQALAAVFEAGAADGGDAAGGAEAVLAALLQAPSFLYLTELGDEGAQGGAPWVRLTAYEIASALAYTVSGRPPDDALLEAAARGELASPEGRETHAWRLLGQSETREHFRRFVLEWLEVDGLLFTAKSATLFPRYEALRPRMLAETEAFTDEVMVYGGGRVRALLDAGFTSVDPEMARFYGLSTWGPRASLRGSPRGGVLQHASFLAAHAREDETSLVKRGDFVARRLLCAAPRRPSEVGIELVFPPPADRATTRERFAAHLSSPVCASCHATIDPLGATFEGFGPTGAARAEDGHRAVDTRATVHALGHEHALADSLALSRWLATEPAVAECWSRQAFRFWSAQSDPEVEQAFLTLVRALPAPRADNLFHQLIAYVRSDLFVLRAPARGEARR